MKLEEFMNRFEIKSKRTVNDWLDKNYIPGAIITKDGEIIIPDRALPPHTGARAKKRESIFVSILKGINSRKQVLPALYGMSEREFERYIDELEKNELLTTEIENGIRYYYPTLKTEEYLFDKTKLRKLLRKLQPLTESVMAGSVKGILEYSEAH